ncbi:hypothetical protein SAY87_010946 [Trapa incisa]|uniref:Uncharacterized protein n=1 Tax=Trapa incisa TaxID=236973 RepID=A0AAN7GM84_9MYRT|nr:hypothetical protein SAY87_010946 [Trapa incisa]
MVKAGEWKMRFLQKLLMKMFELQKIDRLCRHHEGSMARQLEYFLASLQPRTRHGGTKRKTSCSIELAPRDLLGPSKGPRSTLVLFWTRVHARKHRSAKSHDLDTSAGLLEEKQTLG